MKYLIFLICSLFCVSASAQNKKPLVIICDKGDSSKGHPPLSAVGLDNSDPIHLGEQVWYIMLKGKQIFNFKWKQKDDSKLDFAGSFGVRSVNITLDNDSLVVLYSSNRPQILNKEYLWVQSNVSIDEIKQFTSHKMVAIMLVADDNMQYPLFSFNQAQQGAIENASKCFLFNIK
jgi:hypothetical protein